MTAPKVYRYTVPPEPGPEAAEWRPRITCWVLCGACHGARTEGDAMCPACGGEGRIEVREDSRSGE